MDPGAWGLGDHTVHMGVARHLAAPLRLCTQLDVEVTSLCQRHSSPSESGMLPYSCEDFKRKVSDSLGLQRAEFLSELESTHHSETGVAETLELQCELRRNAVFCDFAAGLMGVCCPAL